jgi:hypothetical protein
VRAPDLLKGQRYVLDTRDKAVGVFTVNDLLVIVGDDRARRSS